MKSVLRCAALLLAIRSFLPVPASWAQETHTFASKGRVELGGGFSFSRFAPVVNGSTGDAITGIFVSSFVGYFVADGFEIGVDPLGISYASGSSGSFSSSTTSLNILIAPSYNFITQGIVYPFIEALLGYSMQSSHSSSGMFVSDDSRSGLSWGGRAGVKLAVTDKGLLNLGFQYLQVTLNPSGATSRNGSNQLAVSAGFSIWF